METVNFLKHSSLADHEFEGNIVARIACKVVSLRNYSNLKGDLDLLHFICNCIEAEEKSYSMEQKKEFNKQQEHKKIFKSPLSFSTREKHFPDKYFNPEVKKSIAISIIQTIFTDLTTNEEKVIHNQLEFLCMKELIVRPTALELYFNSWYQYLFVRKEKNEFKVGQTYDLMDHVHEQEKAASMLYHTMRVDAPNLRMSKTSGEAKNGFMDV